MTDPSKVVVPMGQRQPSKRGGGGGNGSGRGGSGSGGSFDHNDWGNKLTRNSTGKPESTTHNTLLVMTHADPLQGLFSLDEFANVVKLTRDACWQAGQRDEFTDQDGTELSGWLGSPDNYKLNVKRDMVMDCVEAMARRRKVHPVREYLTTLVWDGKPRVRSLFPRLFSAEDTDYTRQAAQCFMVSAVARILWLDAKVRHNGAQVDFMLVLEGEQGRGKTSAVRELFGAEWYAESMESPSSKDFYQSLRGRWCVEIGEMDSFSKADVTKVKQAITARFDTYRPSYGRVSRSFRRENIFVGTTNENEYLRDASGGRRFLPVKVNAVHIAKIIAERDQLWAEAVQMFRDGFAWWSLPDDAVEQQDERFAEDSWQGPLQRWLAGRAPDSHYPSRIPFAGDGKPVEWATTTELLANALGIDVGKHGKPEQMRIASIMRRLKWNHERVWVNGYRERRWVNTVPAKKGDSDVPF
ncbi:VapE domain-containing protein [Rhodanobacter sp. BL-MT-08]